MGIEAQARRLKILADAYELTVPQRAVLLEEIAYVQATGVARIAVGAMTGDIGMNNIWWDGQRVGVFGAAMAWLTENWETFTAALGTP